MSLALMPDRLSVLRDRSEMLGKARAFFFERGVMEVDCPLLCHAPALDAHIDAIPASYGQRETCYLHTSPEYGMKRLLAEGIGDIYQLSHVFRDGEEGRRHQPEFCMVEWYREGLSFEGMIDDTFDFLELFIDKGPRQTMTYHEVFFHFASLDIDRMDEGSLCAYLKEKNIDFPQDADRDDLLNLLLAVEIEPKLGSEGLFAITHYPASQAALARTLVKDGRHVAERFEVYARGLELANGYHELIDADEQRARFLKANQARHELGKETYPLDEAFLAALEKGLPDCSGVAVGFDRVMMARHRTNSIADVIPFDWSKS